MTQYVIIVDQSAGNESVGEMWKETYIFNGEYTLDYVMKTILKDIEIPSRKNIVITNPHGEI